MKENRIMKKAILVFDTTPENGGTEELQLALKGFDYDRLVRDLREWLRSKRKYGNKKMVKIEDVEEFIMENMP